MKKQYNHYPQLVITAIKKLIMRIKHSQIYNIILLTGMMLPAMSLALDVNITPDVLTVDVMHKGKIVTIMRNQNQDNTINPAFAKTSRHCPPFCIQPMVLAPGVKTIGELEMLHYLKKMRNGDQSILVIDSRSPRSANKGTIPGSVNIPADSLDSTKTEPVKVRANLQNYFGAIYKNESWDFSIAKTLVMFCNGPWCGQSSKSIKKLLELGYPASKLVWYRGGMQSWESMGLTTLRSEQ